MLTIDKVNIIIASKLGKDPNVVKKINSIYWKEIKNSITNLEDTTIEIKGLVNFTISRYLVRQKILDVIKIIRNTRLSVKFTETKRQFILENYYDSLRKLLKQRNEVAKLYYERDNRISKPSAKSTEECPKDSGRDSEQDANELRGPADGPTGGDNQT